MSLSKLAIKRRKTFFVFLLFVFTSCSRISYPWKTQALVSCRPVYIAERYLLHPQGIIEDIEVELIRTGASFSLYINLLYKPLQITDKTIEVIYFCGEEEFHTVAFVMEGRQRLALLPEAAQHIACFLQHASVSISFAKYHISIPPL